MGITRISEEKVKSLLLPKDATNFSMLFAFVGFQKDAEIFLQPTKQPTEIFCDFRVF
jgi:hypothetical protein